MGLVALMPYITPKDRDRFEPELSGLRAAQTPGEMQYLFAEIIDKYVRRNGGLNYQRINDVLGALDGASKEFYRRVAAPYEDTKIKLNGDVYSPEMIFHPEFIVGGSNAES
jgi:hypothetical protein